MTKKKEKQKKLSDLRWFLWLWNAKCTKKSWPYIYMKGAKTYALVNFSIHRGNRRFVASPLKLFLYVLRQRSSLQLLQLFHDRTVWSLVYPDDTYRRTLIYSGIPALTSFNVLQMIFAEFIIHFSGTPLPKISWFKDGFEIFSSRRTRIITDNGKSVLLIHQTALNDEGEIKCTATNRAGHVATRAKLILEAPPRIRLPRQYEDGLLFEQDETIRLKVSLAGRPTPFVTWYHDGELISKDIRHIFEVMDGESVLRISDAKRSDRGEYTVKVANKLGEDTASFLVTVTDRPAAPGKIAVAMTLGRSVTLSWKEPEDDGGCKIGTYIVEYYRIGWEVWLKAVTSRRTTATLTELIEGSEYKFRVKAENPYGVSDPSEESDVIFIPDIKRRIVTPSLNEKSQSHREISRSRGDKREVSFTMPAQRTRSLTREEAKIRDDESNDRFKYDERSASVQRLATSTLDRSSRADSKVTFALDTLENEPPIPPARSREHNSTKQQVFLGNHTNQSNIATNAKDKQDVITKEETTMTLKPIPTMQVSSPIIEDNITSHFIIKERSLSPLNVPRIQVQNEENRTTANHQFLSSNSIPKNQTVVNESILLPLDNSQSQRILQEHDENALHGSSEFMLVLYPEDETQEEDVISMENSTEIRVKSSINDKQNMIELIEDEDDLIPPPISLSLPELFSAQHQMVEIMREAVSSTELLHERAMERFYRAVAAEEASETAKQKTQFEKQTKLTLLDVESVQRPSLRRRLSNSGTTTQNLIASWQAKKNRRRLSEGQTDTASKTLKLLSPVLLLDIEARSDPNLPSEVIMADPWEKSNKIESVERLRRWHETIPLLKEESIQMYNEEKVIIPSSIIVNEIESQSLAQIKKTEEEENISIETSEESSEEVSSADSEDLKLLKSRILARQIIDEEDTYHPRGKPIPHVEPELQISYDELPICETSSLSPIRTVTSASSNNVMPKSILKKPKDEMTIPQNNFGRSIPPEKPIRKTLSQSYQQEDIEKINIDTNDKILNLSMSIVSETLKTPTMSESDTDSIISAAEAAKSRRMQSKLRSMTPEEEAAEIEAKMAVVNQYTEIVREYSSHSRHGSAASSRRSSFSEDQDQKYRVQEKHAPKLIDKQEQDKKLKLKIKNKNEIKEEKKDNQTPHSRRESIGSRGTTPTRNTMPAKRRSRPNSRDQSPAARRSERIGGASSRSSSKTRNRTSSKERNNRPLAKNELNEYDFRRSKISSRPSSRSSSKSSSREKFGTTVPIESKVEKLQKALENSKHRAMKKEIEETKENAGESCFNQTNGKLALEAKRTVRSTVSYITDLTLLIAAMYIYFFKKETLAIPFIVLLLYRKVQEEIHGWMPRHTLKNKGPPEWIEEDQIVSVQGYVGEDIVIELKLALSENYDDLRFELIRDGLPISSDRYQLSMRGNIVQLTLKQSRKNDTGYYSLVATRLGQENDRGALKKFDLSISEPSYEEDDPPVFLRRLSDLAVKVGTRTRFLVEIRSSTTLKIIWYKDASPIHNGPRFSLVHEGNFHCVDVAPVTVEDQGCWTCMAENRSGRSSCTSTFTIIVPKAYKKPEFVEELRALLTETGTVSLECKVIGVPTPVLRWFKDNKEIKAGDVFALTANPDDPTSLGVYTCEAINCMGTAYSSSKVHVVGRGSREGSLKPADALAPSGPLPIFKQILQDECCRIGDTIVLSCRVQVPPWPKAIAWYNKEGRIEPSEKYHIMEDGIGGYSIEIKQVEAMDEGEWKCVVTSEDNIKQFTSCYVAMSIPRNYRKPRFMENLKAILTEEGLVSFECKVVGFPTPLLRWFKDGQELKPGDVYQLTGTNSLGSYCCIAKNCMGEAKSIAELTIEDIQNQLNEEERFQLLSINQPPKFIKGLRSCEAKINENFRFTVQVSIAPEPTLSWYRDDAIMDESDKYQIAKENLGKCHFEVRNLEFIDQAEWKCVAANDFGHSVTSCFLKLIIPKHYKKPKFLENLRAILSEEGAVNLECKVIGVPQPVLKWYKDNVELKPGDIHRIISGQDGTCCLGIYTCEATNCMGTVSSSASLLGFEDKKDAKEIQLSNGHELARNLSLSTIHEERTSQLYDTPQTDYSVTLDERGEVSFSFDGKEMSVSLYETPDLTEEEALQIVEMYADQLSEHVTEHNVIELPPMRFVKETSTTSNLLMEAVVIDVSPDYFVSAEDNDDLRTEADFEDVSIMDDMTRVLSSPERDSRSSLKRSARYNVDEDEKVPNRPPRKKSMSLSLSKSEKSQRIESESFHSAQKDEPPLSPLSSLKQDDSDTFADALSSAHLSITESLVQKQMTLEHGTIDNRKRSLSAGRSTGSSLDDGIGGDSSFDSMIGVPKKKQRKKKQQKDKNNSEKYSGSGADIETLANLEIPLRALLQEINETTPTEHIEIICEILEPFIAQLSHVIENFELLSLQPTLTVLKKFRDPICNITRRTKELSSLKPISDVSQNISEDITESLINIQSIFNRILDCIERSKLTMNGSSSPQQITTASGLAACLTELRDCVSHTAHSAMMLKENETLNSLMEFREPLLDLQLILSQKCTSSELSMVQEINFAIVKLKSVVITILKKFENHEVISRIESILKILKDTDKQISELVEQLSETEIIQNILKNLNIDQSLSNVHFALSSVLEKQEKYITSCHLITNIEALRQTIGSSAVTIANLKNPVDNEIIQEISKLSESLLNLQRDLLTEKHEPQEEQVLNDLINPISILKEIVHSVIENSSSIELIVPMLELLEDIEKDTVLIAKEISKEKCQEESTTQSQKENKKERSYSKSNLASQIDRSLDPIKNWLSTTSEDSTKQYEDEMKSALSLTIQDLKRNVSQIAIQTSYSESPSDDSLIDALIDLREPLLRLKNAISTYHEPEDLSILKKLDYPMKYLLQTIMDVLREHAEEESLRPIIDIIEQIKNQISLSVKDILHQQEFKQNTKAFNETEEIEEETITASRETIPGTLTEVASTPFEAESTSLLSEQAITKNNSSDVVLQIIKNEKQESEEGASKLIMILSETLEKLQLEITSILDDFEESTTQSTTIPQSKLANSIEELRRTISTVRVMIVYGEKTDLFKKKLNQTTLVLTNLIQPLTNIRNLLSKPHEHDVSELIILNRFTPLLNIIENVVIRQIKDFISIDGDIKKEFEFLLCVIEDIKMEIPIVIQRISLRRKILEYLWDISKPLESILERMSDLEKAAEKTLETDVANILGKPIAALLEDIKSTIQKVDVLERRESLILELRNLLEPLLEFHNSKFSHMENILADFERAVNTVIFLTHKGVKPELKESIMATLPFISKPLDALENVLTSICQTIDEDKYIDKDEELSAIPKTLISCINDTIKSLNEIQISKCVNIADERETEISKLKEETKAIEETTAQPLEELIEAIMESQEQIKCNKTLLLESDKILTEEIDDSIKQDAVEMPQQALTSLESSQIEELLPENIRMIKSIAKPLEKIEEHNFATIDQQKLELTQVSDNSMIQEEQIKDETLEAIISSLQTLCKSFNEIGEMEILESSNKKTIKFSDLTEQLLNLQFALSSNVTESIKKNTVTLLKLSIKILEELQTSIATVQEQMELNAVAKASSSETSKSFLVQAIMEPLKDLRTSIACIQSDSTITQFIQQEAKLSNVKQITILQNLIKSLVQYGERFISIISQMKMESVPLLKIIKQKDQELDPKVLHKTVDSIHILQETLSQIENLNIYKAGLLEMPEQKKETAQLHIVIDSLEKLKQLLIIEELRNSIILVQEQSILNDVPMLKTLNEALENLKLPLTTVKEIVDHTEKSTETEKVLTVLSFANSVEEIASQLMAITKQDIEKQAITETSILKMITIPIEELQNAILKLEDQVSQTLETRESKKAVTLECMIQPLQELQQSFLTASYEETVLALQQLSIKPILDNLNKSVTIILDQLTTIQDVLVDMNTDDLVTLKNFVGSLNNLRTSMVVLQQLNAIENAGQQIVEIENASALQTFAKSIEEFKKCCSVVIKRPKIIKAFTTNVELKQTNNIDTHLIENIIAPLRLLQEQILTIEETKMQESEILNVTEIRKPVTVLSSLVSPLQQLEKSFIATVQKEHIIEHDTHPLITESSFVSLEKLALQPILEEIQKSIAIVQEHVILEAGSEIISKVETDALLKSIAQPLVDLKASIASIQQVTAIAPDFLNELEQQQNISALNTFAETLHNLTEHIAMCNYQQIIIEPVADTISEDVSSLNTWADVIDESSSRITRPMVIDQGTIESPVENATSMTEDDTSTLKTLAKPLTELRECLALIIEEQKTVQPYDTTDSLSEKENISLMKTIIEPLSELKHAVAIIIEEQMAIERANEHSFAIDDENEFIHCPLIEPLEELRHSIAVIEDHILVETSTDRKNDVILNALVEPLFDLQRAISVLETRVISPDVELMSEDANNCITECLATPLHEIERSIADIRQCSIVEPETITVKEQTRTLISDWSIIEKLVKLMKSIKFAISRIEGTVEDKNSIDAFIESLSNFEKCILFLKEEIDDKTVFKQSDTIEIDTTISATLITPLTELKCSIETIKTSSNRLEKSIAVMREQSADKPLVEPQHTNFDEMKKEKEKISAKEESAQEKIKEEKHEQPEHQNVTEKIKEAAEQEEQKKEEIVKRIKEEESDKIRDQKIEEFEKKNEKLKEQEQKKKEITKKIKEEGTEKTEDLQTEELRKKEEKIKKPKQKEQVEEIKKEEKELNEDTIVKVKEEKSKEVKSEKAEKLKEKKDDASKKGEIIKQEAEEKKDEIKISRKGDEKQKDTTKLDEMKIARDEQVNIKKNIEKDKNLATQERDKIESKEIKRIIEESIKKKDEIVETEEIIQQTQHKYTNDIKKENDTNKFGRKYKEIIEDQEQNQIIQIKQNQKEKIKNDDIQELKKDKNLCLQMDENQKEQNDEKILRKQEEKSKPNIKEERLKKEEEWKQRKLQSNENWLYTREERVNRSGERRVQKEENDYQERDIDKRLHRMEKEIRRDETARLIWEEEQRLRKRQEEERFRNRQRKKEQIRENEWSRKRENESDRFLRNMLENTYKPDKSTSMFFNVDYSRQHIFRFNSDIPMLSSTSRSYSWRDSLTSLSRKRFDNYWDYKLHSPSTDKYYFDTRSLYKRRRKRENRMIRVRSINLLKYENYSTEDSDATIVPSTCMRSLRRTKANAISRINFNTYMSEPSSFTDLRQNENLQWAKPKKPSFCTRLTNRTIEVGMRVRLTCTVLGNPEPRIYWTKDDQKLNASDNRYKMRFENGMAYLELQDALPEDAGIYSCVAENTHGTSTTESILRVYSDHKPICLPPTFVKSIKDTYRYSDRKLILECCVRAHPIPMISWLKGGMILQGERYKQSYHDDDIYRLEITDPDVTDNGQYTCRATNELHTEEISHTVNIEDWRSINNSRLNDEIRSKFARRPRFSNLSKDYSVPTDGSIGREVELKGISSPEVKWLRSDRKEPITVPKARTFVERGLYTLIAPDATEPEKDTYVYRAINAYGQMDTSATVDVMSSSAGEHGGKPAIFVSRPSKKSIDVIVGEDISISFRVSGIPKPRIIWMKGLTDITDGPRSYKESIDDYVRLTLKRVVSSDEGTYCILIKNRYGCDRSFFSIKIKQRARSLTPLSDWNSVTERDTEEYNDDMSYVRSK
ncbi:Muscle M-line assembly protein unc-89 [Trachymyrmex septentrionalis]|uniref:Muscle M-line assembly protein unc-89 n=1 Tax=Trachymyrmex septentrionalis TaxID=34720 RepID=A0A195FXE0_9HYME|nr:Muscle M-line assembly protein unc-89 [Trachymyrmex septentrionalis]